MTTTGSAALRADVLGEFRLAVNDLPPFLPRGMHAEILAMLTLEAGRHVSAGRLIDQLWVPHPPTNAAARLHVHISRIRRLLDDLGVPGALATRNDGYVLDLDPDICDHRRFESLTARGTALLRDGDAAAAAAVLAEALALWRGPVLGELGDRDWAQAEAARLSELRWQALEVLGSAHLAAGRPAETVAVLERPAQAEPLRERTAETLMIALYRCGRQAEALAVYGRTRARLAEDLGLDPSPPLAAAYLAILRQDPAVAPVAAAVVTPRLPTQSASAVAARADGAGAATEESGAAGAPRSASATTFALVDVPRRTSPLQGRDALLGQVGRSLDAAAAAATSRPEVVVLVGMGGAGKSRLALELAHRATADRAIVRWMPAAEPVELVESFGRLAADLGITEGADQQVMVARVCQELGRRGDWLLVFDDCPDPAALAPFLPVAGAGTVLVTSRHRGWGKVGTTVLVGALDPAESVQLLTTLSGDTDARAAAELADQLGGLPLALVQAGAYVDQTGMSLARYLEMFRRRRLALLSRAVPDDHRAGVATTWELSFDQISVRSEVAAELLRVCASLGPADITFEMLAAAAAHLDEPLRGSVLDELALEDAILELLGFSLISRDGPAIRLHPLVREVLSQRAGDVEQDRRRIVADAILRTLSPPAPGDSRDWSAWSRWVPHALDLAERHENAGDHELAVPLMFASGRYLGGRALYRTARDALERAVRCGEVAWGAHDRRLAPLHSELGLLLEWLGDLTASRRLQEQALRLLEAAGRTRTPEAAEVLVRLGGVLACQRELGPAMEAQEKALAILDPFAAPLEFGRCLTDLGLSQWMRGALIDARSTFGRAIAVLDGCAGPLSPDAAHARSGQAVVLQDLGELDEALLVQSGVVDSMRASMGARHPDYAHALDKHAYLLRLVGRGAESARGHLAAIDILREVYGGDHVEQAMPTTNLGLAQLDAGDLEAAEAAQRRAMALFAAGFGPHHPHTALAARRLGVVLAVQGRREAAEPLLRQSLADTIAGLGADHPDVAGTRRDIDEHLGLLTTPGAQIDIQA